MSIITSVLPLSYPLQMVIFQKFIHKWMLYKWASPWVFICSKVQFINGFVFVRRSLCGQKSLGFILMMQHHCHVILTSEFMGHAYVQQNYWVASLIKSWLEERERAHNSLWKKGSTEVQYASHWPYQEKLPENISWP